MDSDSGLHTVASELTPLSYGHHTPQFLRQQHQVLEEGESSDSSEHSDTSDHYNRQSSRSRRHHRPRLNPAGGRNRFINSVPPHGTTSYTHSQPHAEVDLNLLKNEKIVWTRHHEKLFSKLAEVLSGQWYTLGEYMGLTHNKLDALKELSGDDLDATVELLRYWVKHWQPTWHALENYIKQLPFINHTLIWTRINKHLLSYTVTKVVIVTRDQRWVEQITQESSRAIDYHCSYALWNGERLSKRSTGFPSRW